MTRGHDNGNAPDTFAGYRHQQRRSVGCDIEYPAAFPPRRKQRAHDDVTFVHAQRRRIFNIGNIRRRKLIRRRAAKPGKLPQHAADSHCQSRRDIYDIRGKRRRLNNAHRISVRARARILAAFRHPQSYAEQTARLRRRKPGMHDDIVNLAPQRQIRRRRADKRPLIINIVSVFVVIPGVAAADKRREQIHARAPDFQNRRALNARGVCDCENGEFVFLNQHFAFHRHRRGVAPVFVVNDHGQYFRCQPGKARAHCRAVGNARAFGNRRHRPHHHSGYLIIDGKLRRVSIIVGAA